MPCSWCGDTGIARSGRPCRECETARERIPDVRGRMLIDEEGDEPFSSVEKIDEAAKIGGQLHQLRDDHRKAMASGDWTRATELQARIAELVMLQKTILAAALLRPGAAEPETK